MTTADPTLVQPPAVRPAEPSLLRRIARGLSRFVRRAPLSAFWGMHRGAIVVMAVAAPAIAPYEPLKSDFRAHAEAADESALVRHRPDRPRYAEPRDLRQPRLAHRGVRRGAVRHHASARCGGWPAAISAAASTWSASA